MPSPKKPSAKKVVPTAADPASAAAETTSAAPLIKFPAGAALPTKDKLPGLLQRLIQLEAWARKVVETVPTIPRHQVDDDIEGT